jgi:hypothetical protein
MQQTTVRPRACAQANAVRTLGIGMTGLVSVLSGAMLAALLVITFLAIGMAGGAGPFVPGLAAATVLGGYLAAAPGVRAPDPGQHGRHDGRLARRRPGRLRPALGAGVGCV